MDVVSALVKRRAALTGDIERTHEVLSKMVLELENLDATICNSIPAIRSRASSRRRFRPPKIGATVAS